MSGISESAVPVVGRGFRLQFEPAQEAHVLLYPEGMVKLNNSAAAIMTRPDLPPRLVAALSVFGSVLVGGSVIYASLSGRDDER